MCSYCPVSKVKHQSHPKKTDFRLTDKEISSLRHAVAADYSKELERLSLATEIYDHITKSVESLGGMGQDEHPLGADLAYLLGATDHITKSVESHPLGADLAYLLGAILKGSFCQWPGNREIVTCLKPLGKKHKVWKFIQICKNSG